VSGYYDETIHVGGLVEVGTSVEDPTSVAMGFEGTLLRRLLTGPPKRGAHADLVGYEIVFENEDAEPLTSPLYAVYRVNDPLLKARGHVLFAGPVRVVDQSGPVVLASEGDPDFCAGL
jgi:hypothetical protein